MDRAIVGRDKELAAADEFLDAVPHGSAALVFEGEPGIGKTTLWREAVRRAEARGLCVLSSRPGPSEARLTFAGLGDFLSAVDEQVFDKLTPPQRRALDVALLRADPKGPAPDQRSVSVAFLSVLRTLSRKAPVLVAVDDVQWLDTPSWHVLEFALRRLETEPVGFLAALRLGAEGSYGRSLGARRVRVGPLSLAALHEILSAQLGHSFARPILVRIERTSGGNPFFALELGRALLESGEPLSGSGALPVPETLRELIERRLGRLPAASREALLVASALSQPTLNLLDRAAVHRAEETGVVRIDDSGRVEFTHPLLASVVYRSASAARRQRVHRELATRVTDAEERARHLALASEGPDANVARTLVEAARSARERGAADAAAELVELACKLTPEDEPAALLQLKLELGLHLSGTGDTERAARVLRDFAGEAPAGPLRAEGLLMLGLLSEWQEGGETAVDLCEQALLDATEDLDLRIEIHAAASRLCDYDTERKVAHARAALDLVERAAPEPRLQALALLAFAEAELYAGRGVRRDLLELARSLEASAEPATSRRARRLPSLLHSHFGVEGSERLLGILLLYADDLDGARSIFEKERAASEYVDEAQLTRALGRLANVELRTGNWGLAEGHLRELETVVERTREGVVSHWSLTIKAQLETLLGRIDTARAAGEAALALSASGSDEWEVARSRAALGFLELSVGNLAEASAHLDHIDDLNRRMGLQEPGLLRYHADHVESLIGLGETDRAEAALARFERQAQRAGGAWALATSARCRGLLLAAQGDLAGAQRSLERALVEHERLPVPFELGRTLLCVGQILRRRKQRAAAREALGRALEIFETLGAPLWADRARAELERTHVREAPHELTPTEARVADLAAAGLTNKKIAERLFVSPKTVEANLARVYRKLGIGSRAELGARMAEREHVRST